MIATEESQKNLRQAQIFGLRPLPDEENLRFLASVQDPDFQGQICISSADNSSDKIGSSVTQRTQK